MAVEKPKFNGIEKYVFSDVYLFYTQHVDGGNSEKYWSKCLEDAHKLSEKYKGFPLCESMLSDALLALQFRLGGVDNRGYTYQDYQRMIGK